VNLAAPGTEAATPMNLPADSDEVKSDAPEAEERP
jgi:hypothetical protein